MTQTLYLLRHARAEPWSPGGDDFTRKLSDRGRRHMLELAAWAKGELPPPDRILCSASQRTRDTLEPLLETWPGLTGKTTYMHDIYEASTGTLHEIVRRAFDESQTLMMVGHNPGFEYLAQAVLRDQDAAGINKMSTGTLAVIDFGGGYEDACGNGRLRHWVKRGDLSID